MNIHDDNGCFISSKKVITFSAVVLLVVQQEGHLACKETKW